MNHVEQTGYSRQHGIEVAPFVAPAKKVETDLEQSTDPRSAQESIHGEQPTLEELEEREEVGNADDAAYAGGIGHLGYLARKGAGKA